MNQENKIEMQTGYLNGRFLPKDEIHISPDDRGFLFADGVYEVVRWYRGFFYDMDGHLARLKRSLGELKIEWQQVDTFPAIAEGLIKKNELAGSPSLVYLQVTRGAAPRTHTFPDPPVSPTVYAFAKGFKPESAGYENGMPVMLKDDIRWSRCDIKSVALLPNTISFQEAKENGFGECIFEKNGVITEGSHSNIFFVRNNTIYTHPVTNNILPGITRKNAIRVALEAGLEVNETAIRVEEIESLDEAFITNTSAEITPVTLVGNSLIGNGKPGPVTKLLTERFRAGILEKERLTGKTI
ncbi:MAG: aminotransferase class IV [Bacteroidales bacterium]